MTPQQQEIAKLSHDIEEEMKGLLGKYLKIFDWDIPENDETAASKRILDAMQDALNTLRQQHLPE